LEAVATLAEPQRVLIRQIFWDESSEDELALLLGISRRAVNKRKLVLLRQLRTALSDAGGFPKANGQELKKCVLQAPKFGETPALR